MRTISAALKTHLESQTPTLATCIKITRADAVVRAFTSYDLPITFEAQLYSPVSSVEASAVKQSVGSGVDNLDIVGSLNASHLDIDDVKDKLYSDASVEVFILNYADLTMGRLLLLKGAIGQLTLDDNMNLQCEIRSLSSLTKQMLTPVNQATCRCKTLGDNECRANLTGLTFSKTVDAVTDEYNFKLNADAAVSGYYNSGIITSTSGDNNGLKRIVKNHQLSFGDAMIELRAHFPFTVQIGDTFNIQKGCDRTFDVCKTFTEVTSGAVNTINFRGEPHLPGNKSVTERGRAPS